MFRYHEEAVGYDWKSVKRSPQLPALHKQQKHLCKYCSYFIKSLYSIQKTPSLLPCAISSWRRCCGQSVHSSDQLPFHEKRPQGLRSRSSLMRGQMERGGKDESQIQEAVWAWISLCQGITPLCAGSYFSCYGQFPSCEPISLHCFLGTVNLRRCRGKA